MTMRSLEVAPSNAAQADAWDGSEGRYWAAHPDRFDLSVAQYQDRFLQAAQIDSRSTVLDVGCGTGETTREAARLATDGTALGVDLSADMIALARTLADSAGLTNATFAQADAQVYPFPEQGFDRVISRTGSMFFAEPAAAFANIARAMQPRARLTLVTWQTPDRNEWIGAFATALLGAEPPPPTPGSPGPFSLSDPQAVRSLLQRTGFERVELSGLVEPMYYGSDVDDAYAFVLGLLGWMLEGRDEVARRRAYETLRATLEDHLTPDGVTFRSATWLVTAHRA